MRDLVISKTEIRSLLLRLLALALSVYLLVSAFPPFMNAESAWVGFVPLILLARYTRGLKRTFLWGWAAGTGFWLFNLGWLLQLSVTGGSWLSAGAAWGSLSIYCGLYTGLFLMLASHLFDLWVVGKTEPETAMGGMRGSVRVLLCLPLVWVGLEYIRGILFTGFPWNGLGVSQFRNIGMIQAASWGGVFAVSAVVMLVNAALAFTLLRFLDMFCRRKGPRFNLAMILGVGGSVAVWLWGIDSAKDWLKEAELSEVRIVAVQPAVPQTEKWDPDQGMEALRKLNSGTSLAAALRPALIVWPETACPDLVNTASGRSSGFAATLTDVGVPILAGAIEYEISDGATNFYNSSLMYMPDGSINGIYRKMHLVPFGERIPLEGLFPSLSKYAPLGFSCTPGRKMTLFRFSEKGPPFSTLICFEDVFPSLSRKAVRNGAKFLINQTNDAWFDGSSGSLQHLANAVFRCVENRVSMVRCSNTGATCFITPLGQLDQGTDEHLAKSGDVASGEGTHMGAAMIADNLPPTFYTLHGNLAFALPCALGTIIVFALAVVGAYRKNRSVSIEGSGE